MSEFTAEDFRLDMIKHLSRMKVGTEWVGEDNDEDYFPNYGYDIGYQFELPGYGTVKTLDSQGMYKDTDEYLDASTSWNVHLIVECQGRCFKFKGTGDSWGCDDSIENHCEEVQAIQKTITVWEKKHDY